MKVRVNNKKVFILMLIILLLILAVGYAVFSEVLTISGTANAKGTFDLEFQNAEIVKSIGADVEKTTAEISVDKNTLTVNAADLAYPGAGVEFSVDIVNVGTIPAEVQSVTPNNVTGSDKIKITGLDGVKVGHPKIEVGDRCNIHFTVEWPEDVTEISEAESTVSFGLQIEYIQSIGEKFDGQVSHIDTNKDGNIINTNTTNTVPEESEPRYETLVSQITAEDYGKSINYKATVKNNETNITQEVSNWKILYNDKSNIYLILDDFLPNNLVPVGVGLTTSGTHNVYTDTNREALLNGLNTEIYWKEFANGVGDSIATGTPNFEIIIKSYNEKHSTTLNTSAEYTGVRTFDNTDKLYVPHDNISNGVYSCWLSEVYPSDSTGVWHIGYDGGVRGPYGDGYNSGIRPMVKLQTTVTGTVGETVEIK